MNCAAIFVLGLSAFASPATRAPAQHVVTGTIVFEDESGVRAPVRAGSIQFWLGGQGGEPVDAPIAGGRFAVALPRSQGWLDVGPITADGVACWAIPSWPDATVPTTAELVAHRVKPAFARFVDAKTGVDLDKGFVFRPADSLDEDPRALARLASPFEIPLFAQDDPNPYRGWIGLREYLVTPRGYVSQRIWLDPADGGTRTFEFEEAAALLLWLPIAGMRPDQHRVLLEREGTSEPWPCRAIPGVCGRGNTRLLSVRDLPGGKWTVRIATKSSPPIDVFPPMYVEVESGRAAELRWRKAELTAIAERERERPVCELRGTLRLPAGVEPESIRLRIAPASGHAFGQMALAEIPGSALARDRNDARVVHWYAGPAPEGRWVAAVPELGWTHEFATAHYAPIALDANPPPAPAAVPTTPVRFRFVDGPTGEELGPERLIVRTRNGTEFPEWNADERAWSTPAVVGRARVEVERRGEAPDSRIVAVEGGPDVAQVTLWPQLFVEVHAYDGDARIGSPELARDSTPRVEPIGHDGRAECPTVTMLRANSYRDRVTQPGRYRVTLAPNPRYAPVTPIEVEVKHGEPVPVVVFRLTRAKR